MWQGVIPVFIFVIICGLILPIILRNDPRPKGCTCKQYNRWSMTVDPNCPIHGDWIDP